MTTCGVVPRRFASRANIVSVFGPGTKPGTTMFTRMPSRPTSFARVWAATVRADFVGAHGQGRHHDDRAAANAAQVWDCGAGQFERSENVYLPGFLPVAEVSVHDGVVRATLGGTAHYDIDPAEVRRDALGQRAALLQVAHVGRHGQTAPAESLQLGHNGVEVLDPARRHGNVVTLARQPECSGPSDARADTGDDGDTAAFTHGRPP